MGEKEAPNLEYNRTQNNNYIWNIIGSLMAQQVKNLTAVQETQETWGRSLGWKKSPGEGNGHPLQYFCLGNTMNRSLVGYNPWGLKESDITEQLTVSLSE